MRTEIIGAVTLGLTIAACSIDPGPATGLAGPQDQSLSCEEAVGILQGCIDAPQSAECSDEAPAAQRIAAGDCAFGGDGKSDTWFDSGQKGDSCWWDWQCSQADGLVCRGVCAEPGPVGAACENDPDCASGYCKPDYWSDLAHCSELGDIGDDCGDDQHCWSGHCVHVYSDGQCLSGDAGDYCDDDDDCVLETCVYDRCRDRLSGSPCSSDAHCDSGTCFAGECE
jgi:hypothetical protein